MDQEKMDRLAQERLEKERQKEEELKKMKEEAIAQREKAREARDNREVNRISSSSLMCLTVASPCSKE